MAVFQYSCVDCLFDWVGLPLFLADIVLDVLAAVSFYREAAYGSLAVLLLLLLGSSVLAQVFSYLWYRCDDFRMRTRVENLMKSRLTLLHVLQMGIYVRHASVLEVSVRSFSPRGEDPGDLAVYLGHDLSMLRLIETFSESAPQLVLMLSIVLTEGRHDPITVLKAVGSVSAVAFCVTTYHRSLRSFLPSSARPQLCGSALYFLWNLLLLAPRLLALALFASAFPCFIFTHFLCSWLLLLFCAWRSNTDFMDGDAGGEWLFRGTVALIWYFSWFGVAPGATRRRATLYHGYALLDVCLLCGVWSWKAPVPPPHAAATSSAVVAVYVLGLVLKVVYYRYFHPNLRKEELKGVGAQTLRESDEPDGAVQCVLSGEMDGELQSRSMGAVPEHDRGPPTNHRMKKLAENFYS